MRHMVTSVSVRPSVGIVSLVPMAVGRCGLISWLSDGEWHRSVPSAWGPSALTALEFSRFRRKQTHVVRAEPKDVAPTTDIRSPLGARGTSEVMNNSRLPVTSLYNLST
jgi:hypothetical protein